MPVTPIASFPLVIASLIWRPKGLNNGIRAQWYLTECVPRRLFYFDHLLGHRVCKLLRWMENKNSLTLHIVKIIEYLTAWSIAWHGMVIACAWFSWSWSALGYWLSLSVKDKFYEQMWSQILGLVFWSEVLATRGSVIDPCKKSYICVKSWHCWILDFDNEINSRGGHKVCFKKCFRRIRARWIKFELGLALVENHSSVTENPVIEDHKSGRW